MNYFIHAWSQIFPYQATVDFQTLVNQQSGKTVTSSRA